MQPPQGLPPTEPTGLGADLPMCPSRPVVEVVQATPLAVLLPEKGRLLALTVQTPEETLGETGPTVPLVAGRTEPPPVGGQPFTKGPLAADRPWQLDAPPETQALDNGMAIPTAAEAASSDRDTAIGLEGSGESLDADAS